MGFCHSPRRPFYQSFDPWVRAVSVRLAWLLPMTRIATTCRIRSCSRPWTIPGPRSIGVSEDLDDLWGNDRLTRGFVALNGNPQLEDQTLQDQTWTANYYSMALGQVPRSGPASRRQVEYLFSSNDCLLPTIGHGWFHGNGSWQRPWKPTPTQLCRQSSLSRLGP